MDKGQVALDVLSKLSGKPAAEIGREMDLVGELGIDSPKALQLLVELEDQLGIEISDESAARMEKVSDVLEFLEALPA